MRYRPKSLKGVLLIVAAVVVLVVAANFFGIGTMRSATRVGYVGNAGWRSWSASYMLLNGTMKHTIHPKNAPETLLVEVETKSGSISIEIVDVDGNVIFSQDHVETSSYDVTISGKVVVRIEADGHKGSFCIKAKQS